MKKKWLFRGLGVIGLVAMAILLMISPVLANTTTTTTLPTPPTAATNAATYTQMSSTGNPEITLNGTLTIGSYTSVYVYFEYGLTTSYGYTTAKVTKKTSGTFSATAITNPAIGTSYNYRADVKYGSTVILGSNQTATIGGGSGGGGSAECDGVYVDSVNGTSIADGGTGTPNSPVSNLTDALAIAASWKVDKIYLIDLPQANGFVFPSDLTNGFTFIGDCTSSSANSGGIDLNGKDMYGSVFWNCLVIGDGSNGAGEYHNCGFEATNVRDGAIFDSLIDEDIISGSDFYDCTFIKHDGSAVQLSQINSHGLGLFNVSGAIVLENIDRDTTIMGNGLSLTLDSTCTSGTISLYGDITLTDNSDGTVVNNYTLQNAVAQAP